MQTFNNAVKQKDVQATSVKPVNAECMVTEATIYDDYAAEEEIYNNQNMRSAGEAGIAALLE